MDNHSLLAGLLGIIIGSASILVVSYIFDNAIESDSLLFRLFTIFIGACVGFVILVVLIGLL